MSVALSPSYYHVWRTLYEFRDLVPLRMGHCGIYVHAQRDMCDKQCEDFRGLGRLHEDACEVYARLAVQSPSRIRC